MREKVYIAGGVGVLSYLGALNVPELRGVQRRFLDRLLAGKGKEEDMDAICEEFLRRDIDSHCSVRPDDDSIASLMHSANDNVPEDRLHFGALARAFAESPALGAALLAGGVILLYLLLQRSSARA